MTLPISNFHTHTKLCHHADGLPEDYYRQALKDGCSCLGFSDHTPYPDPKLWDDSRMQVSEIPFYVECVNALKENSTFPVYLGFECEYDRGYKNWYEDLRGKYNADYLVFGPHWVVSKTGQHIYIPTIEHDVSLLNLYTEQVVEGIYSGLYNFIAHPDLFMLGWHEWDSDAEGAINEIIKAAIDCKLPLEINGLGIKRGMIKTSRGERYNYPYQEAWEMISEKKDKAKIICNADAHNPLDVIQSAREARKYAERFGFDVIESIF